MFVLITIFMQYPQRLQYYANDGEEKIRLNEIDTIIRNVYSNHERGKGWASQGNKTNYNTGSY